MMSDWDTSFLSTCPPDEQGDSLAIGLESVVVQLEYRYAKGTEFKRGRAITIMVRGVRKGGDETSDRG